MTTRVLIPIADGFEEIEAVTLIDVLRRAELDVVVASLVPGPVTGAHGIRIEADTTLDAVDPERVDQIVLPGGMGGTLPMMEEERLLELLRSMHASGRPIAAICAAPMVLARAGIEEGHALTSHPSVRDRLGRARVEEGPRVLHSGTVITSQGPGTALELALALVEEHRGAEARANLAQAMVVGPPPQEA